MKLSNTLIPKPDKYTKKIRNRGSELSIYKPFLRGPIGMNILSEEWGEC